MQTDELRYAGIDPCEICNGLGFGVTLFTQGCSRHCEGCHNPSTWDRNGGKPFDAEAASILTERCSDPHMTRLTISGGEPFESDLTLKIARWYKDNFPEKSLWIYTGYTFDDVISDRKKWKILRYADVLVDGCFVLAQRDITLAFRGSTNQRIIDVRQSILHRKTILFDPDGFHVSGCNSRQ